MTTDTPPDAIRDRALSLIALRLQRTPRLEDALAAFGDVVVANLLVDLEQAFDIGLEVDEALPHGTVGGLLDLVARRARSSPGGASIHDLAAARARRAQVDLLDLTARV